MVTIETQLGLGRLFENYGRIGLALLTTLALSFAGLWIVNSQLQQDVQRGRVTARLARDAMQHAADRQGGIRGYVVTRNPGFLARDEGARAILPLLLDSLAERTRYHDEQHARAVAFRDAIHGWERGFASSAVTALAGSPAVTLRADERLFDAVRAAYTAFLRAEEALYASRQDRAATFRRWMLIIVLGEFVMLGWALETMRRRARDQAADLTNKQTALEEQAIELEQQVEELNVLTEELTHSNTELEREAASRALAESGRSEANALLDFVIASAPVAIALHDAEGRFKILNRAYAELTGLDPAYHVGRTADDLEAEAARELAPVVRDVLARGTPRRNIEFQTNGLHGTELRSWSASVYPVSSPARGIDGAAGIVVETTEQRRLEQQLLQSQKMESIGRLAGGVAHDFNNLLTVILSYAAFAREQAVDNATLVDDLLAIEEAGRRAAALTGQLLAFSRKQVLQPQLIDLNEVVESLDRMLRRVIGSDIEMSLNLAIPLPHIHADRGQLEQVLMNLIVNARDALRGNGRISIETSERSLDGDHAGRRIGVPPGRYVLLAVSDTGVGMPPDVLRQVFEPFFTTKPAGEGTGLGLSTVYGIVKQSGGDLWVYSEEGVGTTFKLYFPVAAPDEASVVAPTHARHVATGHETILVVEDDATLRPLTTRILRSAGYQVLTASNGLEALALAARHEGTIDLVATDVVMPHVSGGTLAAELAAVRPGIRILFLSGYTDDDLMRRGVVQHESAFLQKPFTPLELTTKAREVLDG